MTTRDALSNAPCDSDDTESSLYDPNLDDPFSIPDLPFPQSHLHDIGISLCEGPSLHEITVRGNHPLRFCFAHAFGDCSTNPDSTVPVRDEDIISAVAFSPKSDMLATGDKGGRIVILKRAYQTSSSSSNHLNDNSNQFLYEDDDCDKSDDNHSSLQVPNYKFWTQFKSHDAEFDYLKSLDIEEKINQIKWCPQISGARRLLATNDKTIKLWRIYEQDVKELASMDTSSLHPRSSPISIPVTTPSRSPPSPNLAAVGALSSPHASLQSPALDLSSKLHIPKLELRGRVIKALQRRVFANSYHINSISVNTDGETFLSADDLRINLWNMNRGGAGVSIHDIKPDNMSNLTEVITCAEFHPKHSHLLMHSTSRGIVKLSDLRQSALCNTWARQFHQSSQSSNRNSFFSEILASICDIKFSPNGRYILTRDYMNLRLWDINMERDPLLVVPVHEHLRSKLCNLYENDCIFDKFQCNFSSDGGSLLTGSYNSLFKAYSAFNGIGTAVGAHIDFVVGTPGRYNYSVEDNSYAHLNSGALSEEMFDPSSRIKFMDSSRTEQISAVAAGPAVYIYYEPEGIK